MKRVLSIFLICIIVFSFSQVQFEAQPENVVINSKSQTGAFTVTDSNTNTDTNTVINAMYTTYNGQEVSMYPLMNFGSTGSYSKVNIPSGINTDELMKFILFSKETGFAKINANLNLYGEGSILNDDDFDIAITAGIWIKWRYNMSDKYLEETKNNNKYYKVGKWLVANYSKYNLNKPTFNVDSNKIKTLESSDTNYNYYGPFSYSSNSSNIASAEINISDAKIVDETKYEVNMTNLSAGRKYFVAIPKNNNIEDISIKLSLQYVGQGIAVFGDSYNIFVGVFSEPFQLNETMMINSLSTAKIYAIAGTIVNVKSENESYDRNITIGLNGVGYAENLSVGKYTAKEIIAPPGFVVSSSPKEFSITSSGSIIEIDFEAKASMGTLQVINKNTAGTILVGSAVNVYQSDGILVKTLYTSDVTTIELPVGNYYVIQQTVVDGYKLNSKKVDVIINANALSTINIINEANNSNDNSNNNSNNNVSGSSILKILAVDEWNFIIPNLEFSIQDGTNFKSTKALTNSDGIAIFQDMKPRGYTISCNPTSQYKQINSFTWTAPSSGTKVLKIIVRRATTYSPISTKLPLIESDSYIDQFNTGVNNSKTYNKYLGEYDNKPDNSHESDIGKYTIINPDKNVSVHIVLTALKGKKSSKSLQNIELTIKDGNVKLYKGKTDNEGNMYLSGFDPNHEYTIEINTDDINKYEMPSKKDLKFSSSSDNTTIRKYIVLSEKKDEYEDKEEETSETFNSFIPISNKTNIIIKTVNENNIPIDAEYTIYDSNGKEVIIGKPKDSNKTVEFTTDVVGKYSIRQTKVQDGYELETEPYILTVSNQSKTIPLNVTNKIKLATLVGLVFEDKNGNNVFDEGEAYKAAKLTISDGTKSITVYSGATGEFVVSDLPKGTYTVTAEKINGTEFVEQKAGNNRNIDSDVNSVGVGTIEIHTSNIKDFGVGFRIESVKNIVNNNTNDKTDIIGVLPQTGNANIIKNLVYIFLIIVCILLLIFLNKDIVKLKNSKKA